ncbi:MAG: T9SS type A sorting domain-containing protein, partial [Opitutaceae bacterium]|nr:T9SS type A sorting domain-containing protein [Cytophagales bacterium]
TAMLSTGLPAYVKDDRYSFATRGSVLYLIRETPVSGGGQTDLNGSIYKYDFTTNSWSLRTGSYVTGTGYGGGTYGAKVDPVNLNKVYVPHERLRIYNDVSQTFKEESNYELLKTENCANIHADFNDLEFASNDNTTLYSTNDGFVSAYKINSTDNLLCDAWLPINGAGLNGLDAYTVNSSVDLPNTVLVSNWHNPTCLYDGNISTQADQFRALGVLSDFTENYGPNFFYKGNKFLGLPSNGNYYKWCEKSGTTLAISDFILKTTLNPNGDFVYPTMLNPPVRHVNDPYQIFIGQAQVYKSLYINSGTDNKFEEVSSFPSDESVTHIATSFSNPNNLFVGTAKDSAVYKSDGSFSTYLKIPYLYKVNHNTKAWTKISFNFPRRGLGIEGIAVNSINENNIIINIDRSMIYETLDGGITWSVISGVGKLSSSFYYTLTAEKGTNGRFLIATKNGIFYKDADNPTWQSYGVNFPGIILWSIDVNYSFNTLYAAASQAGIWKAPLICPSQANRTIMYRLHTYYEAQKLSVDNALSEPNFNLQLRGSESIVLTNATFAPDYGRSVMGYIHGCNPTSVPSGTFYRQEEVAENNEMASPDEKSESDMISATEGIKISPNPSTGPIKVESKLNQGENFQYLQISDINGKIVFETKKYETAINVELNPSQTSYYLVSFVTDKRKVVKKVVTPINGADPNQDYSFKKRN